MAAYQVEQWHDFFLTVGGGAAALTGLVVVAASLHLRLVTKDPVLLNRARMIPVGLTGVFARCSLALMGGQCGRVVGVELFVVCLVVAIIGLISYAPVLRAAVPHGSSFLRMIAGQSCYATEMFGAVLLFLGAAWGLTMAAVAMIANILLMISSSWLLLLGLQEART